MSADNRADAVIAGAGIAGVAIAWQLAERMGQTDTVLVDPRLPLTLTSSRSGENYREWWPERPMVDLVRRSVILMEDLLDAGGAFTMNRRGYLYVTTDAATAAALPDLAEPYRRAGIGEMRMHRPGAGASTYRMSPPEGIDHEPDGADLLLDPAELRAAYPHLAPEVAGAIHARSAGTVDPIGLGSRMLELAQARGVRLVRGQVTGVDVSGSHVEAVTVEGTDGTRRIATRSFVDAAGPFAGEVARLAGAELAVEAILEQKVLLHDPLGAVPRDAPFMVLMDPQTLEWSAPERERLLGSEAARRFLEPMPGGICIKPDGQRDADTVLLAWAYNHDLIEIVFDPACPPDFPRAVLNGATRAVPGLRPYLGGPSVARHVGGLYMKTPDGLPLIGPLEVEGAYAIAGLAGFGVMVACAAGELVASWITGDAPALDPLPFVPTRFRDPAYLAARSGPDSTL
jgi:glycine/D-amino acid oxidase-like deaminating enzyme